MFDSNMFKAQKIHLQLNQNILDEDYFCEELGDRIQALLYAFATFINSGSGGQNVEIHMNGEWGVEVWDDPMLFWSIQKIHPQIDVRLLGFTQETLEALSPILNGRTDETAIDTVARFRSLDGRVDTTSQDRFLYCRMKHAIDYAFQDVVERFLDNGFRHFERLNGETETLRSLQQDRRVHVESVAAETCVEILMDIYVRGVSFTLEYKYGRLLGILRKAWKMIRTYEGLEQAQETMRYIFREAEFREGLRHVEREMESGEKSGHAEKDLEDTGEDLVEGTGAVEAAEDEEEPEEAE